MRASSASATGQRDLPTRVGEDSDWTAVATGGFHSLAVKRDGSAWGWGRPQSRASTASATGTTATSWCVGEDSDLDDGGGRRGRLPCAEARRIARAWGRTRRASSASATGTTATSPRRRRGQRLDGGGTRPAEGAPLALTKRDRYSGRGAQRSWPAWPRRLGRPRLPTRVGSGSDVGRGGDSRLPTASL